MRFGSIKINVFVIAIYILFSVLCPFGDTTNTANAASRIQEQKYNTVSIYEYGEYDVEEDFGIMPVAASSYNFKTYDHFSKAYFEGLTDNFGYNTFGSCGYIALAMLLTYYDNFVSDKIVSERYDMESAGSGTNMILRDNSPGSYDYDFSKRDCLDDYVGKGMGFKDATATDYFRFISDMQESSLHARLIYLGEQVFNLYNFNEKENCCGISADEMALLLMSFLQNESSLKHSQDFTLYNGSGKSNDVRTSIISEVNKGNPVIVGVADSVLGVAHACIAYAYDENTDELYFHPGWKSCPSKMTLSDMGLYGGCNFDKYFSYLYVRFNLAHVHSNNYAVEQVDGTYKYYCYCSDEIVTYKHDKCNYIKYENNGTTHTAYCACENSVVQNHSYTSRYVKKSDLLHTEYCVCGKSQLSAHTWTSGGTINGKSYLKCIGCGYMKENDGDTPIIMKKKDLQDFIDIAENASDVDFMSFAV